MDKAAASSLIQDTFQQPFDKGRYIAFVKNLLNTIDEEKAFSYFGQYVPDKFRDFVKGYERIGTYTDPSDQKVDVLIVYLKNDATLARARTSQRNFISNYLKTRDAKDAGLIAFVAPNPEEWRFSFVKMEYKLVEKKGKVRAEEEFTPARRYSFLVGQHESSHTAQRQLLPILADDKHNPTLEIIENAFNIETVTKEFFDKYRELFLQVKEALDALAEENAALKKEFEAKNVNTADFAKKLLGQIVFLYFLQKKGWFGVERDSVWGSGPKNFLRQLFKGELMQYGNFFNDVLEPLFYEALAVERESNFYSKFNCKIPFLNGGLFDPLNSYDWVHTDITLPNELFSNDVRTKEGDIGTGILDMFDRYNFTVKEDEPLEKEVAVDPEMLGKVFENLLEVNDRKSKGTYYTPREIVHYMCQESIINYLATELEGNVSKDDITMFIHMGDTVIEHEIRVVKKGEETDRYSFKLPESIRKNAALIDQKLSTIRVCDPAIGSGAFPVGMMNEIVRARQTLTSYLPANEDRLPYDFKRHAIQESLYGVDIDPGAVEIAKLRLWLSLIVDEDDIERIKPLPNLDYRIMQGNSLLEEFEGIRLFDERLLESTAEEKEKQLEEIKAKMGALQQEYFALHSDGKLTDARKEEIESEIKRQKAYQKQLQTQPQVAENMGIFDTPSKVTDMLTELKGLHRAFFEATQRKKKEELKNKIEALEWELVETSLTERNKGALLAKLKATRTRPFFLWKLYFFEVFQQKGGFDVVIANPPYVFGGSKKITKEDKKIFKKTYFSGSQKINLFTLFIELGLKTLKKNGYLTYVVPNTLLRVTSYSNIREYIYKNSTMNEIVDLDVGIFEKVTASTIVFSASNRQPDKTNMVRVKRGVSADSFEIIQQTNFNSTGYIFDIFSSDTDREIIQRLYEGSKKLTAISKYIRFGVVIADNYKQVVGDKKISSQWKPFLEGDEIDEYVIHWKGRYLNYDPTLLHRGRTPDVFEVPKILVQRITGGSKPLKAVYDKNLYYSKESLINIILDENGEQDFAYEYILALINSSLLNWFYKNKFTNESKLTVNISKEYLGEIPIKKISKTAQSEIVELVRTLEKELAKGNKSQNASSAVRLLLQKIDDCIFDIYGLTEQERDMIRRSVTPLMES